MKTLDELNQLRGKILAELDVVDKQIANRKADTVVQCESNHAYVGKGCGMGHKIKDLDYIQSHWYESPHGCTGGDNWNEGEGLFDCPSCGYRNRLYNRPDIEKLKYLFRVVLDQHEH